ncbi:immune-associated nucleotide-binding protein 10 [Elysia marginata]|uniref:Immune-associated nucleotide-binding protein 10 n=1 Tax=Elysia marginata TaxID=1093978 RepID=A0AAV4IXR0_9GAST|nr:immune-associated nucleotide-binding protein 10 [Elysia marginata]
MEQAMMANPRGYHAFLLTVRFGCRFTAEDKDVIRFLKHIFGHDFVRRFCILVMTCGDNFERESEETGQTFSQWCAEQTDVFQELLKECNNRVVLFDNVTRDEAKRNAQIDRLLAVVNGLQAQGHRYTDRNFELAQAARQRAVVESRKPVIQDYLLQETSLILQKLVEVRDNLHGQDPISFLQSLLQRCDRLKVDLLREDNGTGALGELRRRLAGVRNEVQGALSIHLALAEERRIIAQRQRDMIERQQRDMQLQQQYYQNQIALQNQQFQQNRAADSNNLAQQQQQFNAAESASQARQQELQDAIQAQRPAIDQSTQQFSDAYTQARTESNSSWLGKVFGFFRWLFGFGPR